MPARSEPLLWVQLIGAGVFPLEGLLLLLLLAGSDPGPFPALERLLSWALGGLAPTLLLWTRPADVWSLLLLQTPLRARRPLQQRLSRLQDNLGLRLGLAVAGVLSLPLLWWLDEHAAVASSLSPLQGSPRLVVLLLSALLLALMLWQWQQLLQALWLLSRSPELVAAARPMPQAELEERHLCLGLPLLLLDPLSIDQAPATTGGAGPSAAQAAARAAAQVGAPASAPAAPAVEAPPTADVSSETPAAADGGAQPADVTTSTPVVHPPGMPAAAAAPSTGDVASETQASPEDSAEPFDASASSSAEQPAAEAPAAGSELNPEISPVPGPPQPSSEVQPPAAAVALTAADPLDAVAEAPTQEPAAKTPAEAARRDSGSQEPGGDRPQPEVGDAAAGADEAAADAADPVQQTAVPSAAELTPPAEPSQDPAGPAEPGAG